MKTQDTFEQSLSLKCLKIILQQYLQISNTISLWKQKYYHYLIIYTFINFHHCTMHIAASLLLKVTFETCFFFFFHENCFCLAQQQLFLLLNQNDNSSLYYFPCFLFLQAIHVWYCCFPGHFSGSGYVLPSKEPTFLINERKGKTGKLFDLFYLLQQKDRKMCKVDEIKNKIKGILYTYGYHFPIQNSFISTILRYIQIYLHFKYVLSFADVFDLHKIFILLLFNLSFSLFKIIFLMKVYFEKFK